MSKTIHVPSSNRKGGGIKLLDCSIGMGQIGCEESGRQEETSPFHGPNLGNLGILSLLTNNGPIRQLAGTGRQHLLT